ncbi:TIM-barrel domain-containing protein [Allorhizocola rhizosphaerae]|uniref:glycoside hydrolase family 31 protein n=1 Tax=Allorhizocola rhizosphaerae TaxID=1872709 RepID=UPI000E3B5D74|nr:glycoside hydrolase family 31 protein [Allorhizocola rhizosphaerae]
MRVWARSVLPGVVLIGCGEGEGETDGTLHVRFADSGGVTVLDESGEIVCTDGPDGGPCWSPDRTQAAWARHMPPGTRYFGLGERTGLLDKKGRRHVFWNTDQYEHQGPEVDRLYQSIPFYLAVDEDGRCHGVLLDTTHRCAIDLSDERGERLVLEVANGRLDHFVIAGPTPELVLQRLTALTGRMPLPPRWALGYHHARWGYPDEATIRGVAERLRADGVPADVIYLDIDHQDGYRAFTWSPDSFPDPRRLTADLTRAGFKTAVTVNLAVKYQPEGGYEVFDDGLRREVFLREPRDPKRLLLRHVWPGLCVFPDFARPDVRKWWGQWYLRLRETGVSVMVNDMNEPAMHDRPIDDPAGHAIDPPPSTVHGPPDGPTTHAAIHNVYATLENQAAYEALRDGARTRPLLLTRAGSTGVQRYAAVWTGDNHSLWEYLEMSLPQLLNLGLSGVAFCGADIGGFFGNCGPELLIRWYQLGAWYPLARNNCAKGTADQEPWVWGDDVLDACRRALRKRYRLLPYWYTLFAQAAETGAPMLRPLFYHYPADRQARLREDEAMLGADLLLAPVLRPGRVGREVYLPEGRWYGLHDGTVHDGPRRILTDAPLHGDMPVYARGGAIVPTGPDLLHSDEKPLDPLTLNVYPGVDGTAGGTLYEDDGLTFSYLDGQSCITKFMFEGGALRYHRTGDFEPPPERRLIVRAFDPARPGY